MKEIQFIPFIDMDNEAHFRFVLDMVNRAEADAVIFEKCAEQVKALRDAVTAAETAKKEETHLSDINRKIMETDRHRDQLYLSYEKAVTLYAKDPVTGMESMAKSAKVLQQHIKDCKVNPQAQLDEETSQLVKFIQDLEGKLAAHVAELSLEALVEKLKAANEEVRSLTFELPQIHSLKIANELKYARASIDEAFKTLVQHVNARALLEGDADYAAFIDYVNDEIRQFQQETFYKKGSEKKEKRSRAIWVVLAVLAVLAAGVGAVVALGYADDIIDGVRIIMSSMKQSEYSTQNQPTKNLELSSSETSSPDYSRRDETANRREHLSPSYLKVQATTVVGYTTSIPANLTIPNNITEIAPEAFRDCTSLASISIPASVRAIGARAFMGCTLFENIDISYGVTEIASEAFRDCTSLASVSIPASVTEIGIDAFNNCTSLVNITILGLTEISIGAFHGCTSLVNVRIFSSVKEINDRAFAKCTSLVNIDIPNSVTKIGAGAFRDCTLLASVTIPAGVTEIGDGAFGNCISLAEIHFTGTSEQWNAITEEHSVESGVVIHCKDGDFTVP